jgi:hypothetical protein
VGGGSRAPAWWYSKSHLARDPIQLAAFSNAVLDRILALPGVLHAAISTGVRFAPPGYDTTFEIRHRHEGLDDPQPHAAVMYETPSYFETMRIPLIKGRFCTPAEMRAGNASGNGTVRVIDDALAKRFWPDRDPIGSEIGNDGQWSTIVGIVGTVHDSDLSTESQGTIYVPGYGGTSLVVRTGSDPKQLYPAVREQVHAVSPDEPIYDEKTMSDMVATSLQTMAIFRDAARTLCGAGGFTGVQRSLWRDRSTSNTANP